MKKPVLFLFFAVFQFVIHTAAQTISIFAGMTGVGGFSGDGGPATAAKLQYPRGIAFDAANNLYITDQGNQRIRKVNAVTGIITTIAGNGTMGFWGDGSPATTSILNNPLGIITDPPGNIYIAEYSNSRIRKINTSSIISTFAGSALVGSGGDNGPATSAALNRPYYIDHELGNLYIADNATFRVRMVNSAGIIRRIGGNGTSGFTTDGVPATSTSMDVCGVTVDAAGNIYVSGGYRVRKIDAISGIITTYAGNGTGGLAGDGGPATSAQLLVPQGLDMDAAGNLYIVDGNRVRKVNSSGIITSIATTGVSDPQDVKLDYYGDIYIVDGNGNKIWKITMPTYPPSFIGGSPQSLTVCDGSGANAINTLLAVDDASPGRTLTWSMVSGPAHGSAAVSYTTTSTGATVTPTGLTYTPTAGYSGPDAFTTQVTDGTTTVTTTINVTVTPAPSAGTITGPADVCVSATMNLTDAAAGGTWSAANATATVSPGGVVTGVSAGNNVISYSVTNTCGTAVATHSISISAPPSAGSISGASTVCVSSSITLSNTVSGGTWSSSGAFATISPSGVVTGIAAGTEIITYTVSNACGSASVTASISVNTGPSAGVISGLSQVCEGASISLSETVTGGSWSSSNANATVSGTGVVAGITAGTSVISYTISSACGSTSATHTVTINPLPLAGTISGPAAVCVGATVNLTDPVTGGTWISSNTNATVTTAGAVTGMAAGVVTISYTVTNSCGAASATHAMTVNTPPVAGSISGPGAVCVGSSVTLSGTVAGGTWSSSGVFATVGTTGIVTGISTGAETITYSVTNACGTATTTAVVNVAVGPTPGVISGATTVCEGAAISLSETVSGGTWSADNANATINGSGVVTGISAGTVTISYTLTSSCGITAAIHNVTVIALPVAGTITGTNSVCVGAATTLANAATGGVWSTVNGNASISPGGIVTGVTAGVDTVVYTVTNSCGTATAKFPITVLPASDCTTGSGSVATSIEPSLNIYPNPSNGVISISVFDNLYTETKVTITNVVGKIVMERIIPTNVVSKMEIQAEAGVYFVSSFAGTKTLYKKLVIVR